MTYDWRKVNLEIGQEIKRLREEKGLSQQKMADRIGIHRLAYRRIELGERTMSLYEAINIATVLETNVSLLAPVNLWKHT